MKYRALDSGTEFGMEISTHPLRVYMKYWALRSGTEISMEIRMLTKNIYEVLGTGFSMEIRMPIQNVYEILGTRFCRYITCYIYSGPIFSCESNGDVYFGIILT